MAKKTDPFEKFREATLNNGVSLGSALGSKTANEPEPATPVAPASPAVQPAPVPEVKTSKNADKELVSFHISKAMKKQLDLLKVESDKSLKELYTEAVEDLLAKYGRQI